MMRRTDGLAPKQFVPRACVETCRRKHRILHVFGAMNLGGAETRTVELMARPELEDFEFHFATLGSGDGALDETIRRSHGEIHTCPLGWSFPSRFRDVLRQHRIDVVHSHVHHFSGVVLWLASRAHTAGRIAHIHTTGDGHSDTLRRYAQRRILAGLVDAHATAIVGVSEGAMDAWRPAWRTDPRCRVIYNGVAARVRDADARRRIRGEFAVRPGERLMVHVGTLVPWKNQERIVRILSLLRRTLDVRLLLVGRDGGSEASLRTLVHQLQLNEAVTFAGERTDVDRLFAAADLMIFPSTREGLPGAVLEASVVGVPVLASDLPGCLEIARRCASVRCLGLAEPNERWAWAAQQMILAGRPAVPEWRGGIFDVSTCASAMRNLYLESLGPSSGWRNVS